MILVQINITATREINWIKSTLLLNQRINI